MRKSILFLAAFAALVFTACQKNEKIAPEGKQISVNFVAGDFSTKTIFGEKNGSQYPVLWQEGDKICPSLNFSSVSSSNYITVEPSEDGKIATFKGKFNEAESYHFICVSPAATFKSVNKTNQTIMVEFPAGQTSTAASPDPEAQILYANTGELAELPDPINLSFSHLSAYLHLKFEHVALGDAVVQAVNITNNDYPIAGRVFYHLDTDTFEASTVFHTIAVATTTLDDVWCALCPADFSGKELTIEVSTDKGTLTKTLTMPASANLTRGNIAKFTVDMDGIALNAPVVYKAITSVDQLNVGDKVIIAAAGVDQSYAMSTGQNTNNRSAAGVTKTAEEIVNPIETVEILQLENGIIPGHFAFRTTNEDGVQDPNNNDGYLYAANQASSGSNILKTQATMDNSASWAVSIGDVTVGEKTWENATIMFADIPSSGRGMLRFNSNDKLFSAYGAGTSMEAIKIYRLDKAASLSFNATLPNGNEVPASEQEVPVYVWGNVAWTASVTGGASLSATSGTGNTVLTLSVPANTDTENTKSYSVTVTTSAAVATQSYTLNITQAKKIDAGGDPVVVYSFSLDEKPNPGSNGTYAGACDVTIGGITWNVTGVSNSSDYFGWRLGGKSLTNVDRAIYSKTALPAEVTKVIVSHCRANITINSYTLTVHSSATDAANGSNPIASLTATVNVGTQDAPATTTFEKTDNTPWAGCFYRLTYNVTNTTTSNKYVEFRGLEIWGYPSE